VPVNRPAVDVVIPFAGPEAELAELLARSERAATALPGDSVLVADNRPPGARAVLSESGRAVTVVRAAGRRSSYHARNVAAGAGSAAWILFLDADVEWEPSLLDAYFDPPPGEHTAVVGGGIADSPPPSGRAPTAAERYAIEKTTMASATTLAHPERMPYAQTANCLVRRAAFEAVGGFADTIRSGGDADLCFRLQREGWLLEQRPAALAVHRNRRTLGALVRQKVRHGAGAAWLERRHPGTYPRRRLVGLARWSARQAAAALAPRERRSAARSTVLVDVALVWAFELGRLLGNEPPSLFR
jgi:GT2 family glycosyltransferase